jgi:hypothetical protein
VQFVESTQQAVAHTKIIQKQANVGGSLPTSLLPNVMIDYLVSEERTVFNASGLSSGQYYFDPIPDLFFLSTEL